MAAYRRNTLYAQCTAVTEHIKDTNIKLVGWYLTFFLISITRHCPSPSSPEANRDLTLPSVQDLSQTRPGSGESSVVWSRGYYLGGHGCLHMFCGCPWGVFSQLLANRIHLEPLWVTRDLHSTLSLFKNKWDELWQAVIIHWQSIGLGATRPLKKWVTVVCFFLWSLLSDEGEGPTGPMAWMHSPLRWRCTRLTTKTLVRSINV